MKNIRIGNDITIKWTINRQGEPEDFSGKSVSIQLLEPFSNTSASINYIIEGNIITIYFNGKDQKKTGQYTLKLVENEGKAGMITLDICNPFTLVSKSCMAGGYGECSNVDVETIELTSRLDVGKDGKSAYEIALSEGFEGSEAEWLASLKGDKGEKGDKGDIGLTGPQGPQGVQGEQGIKGDKGDAFTYNDFTPEQLAVLKGEKGDIGPVGPQGIQGIKGDTGDKGDQGETGSVYTPSVDNEGNLSWTNNGGLENPETVNIRGPQGIQGEIGPQGIQGPKGDTYDDTEVRNTISSLQTALNSLVSGDVTTAIDNFNEVVAFLEGIEDSQDLASIIASIERQIAAKQDSISDLEAIRSGAAKGATALQSFTETDPTVPAWAKAATKPSYTASEVGALPDTTTIPTKTSQLTNDSNYIKSDGNLTNFEVVTALPASPEAKTMYIILKS